jgi:peptidoglycan/xylan/chitin deacetylase (PgdA/CDA1 family)
MKKFLFIIILFVFIFEYANAEYNHIENTYMIAKWFENKDSAISLRFDDSSASHIEKVIPLLNLYDIKATFMINPGRKSYKKYKNIWENKINKMGHNIGNHTWHHKGADSLEEAEFEIGAVTKLIWKLYPNKSKLNLFASGGGEKWGGKRWRDADLRFKDIVKKYHMIDLYNGEYDSIYVDTSIKMDELLNSIDKNIKNRAHQAYTLHNIRNTYTSLEGLLRLMIKGFDIAINEERLKTFIEYLDAKRNKVWLASLLDIIKYENEFKNAKLEIIEENDRQIVLRLSTNLDLALYDHPLTLVCKKNNVVKVRQIFYNNIIICPIIKNNKMIQTNIKYENSKIIIDIE